MDHAGHHVRLSGATARLVWGYRTAAELGAWTIAKQPGGWRLHAALTSQDAYLLRQRPLLVTIPRAQGFWTWTIEALTVEARALTATLGPPVQG